MTVDVVTDIVIASPIDVVYSYAVDPVNAPHWYSNIASVEWRSDPGVERGARVAFVAHFLGRRLEYTYEIVELLPEQRLVMRTEQGPFPMETTYTWEVVDAGHTRMVLRNRGEPAGFSRLTAPVMEPAMRRANRKDLRALKLIIETSGG